MAPLSGPRAPWGLPSPGTSSGTLVCLEAQEWPSLPLPQPGCAVSLCSPHFWPHRPPRSHPGLPTSGLHARLPSVSCCSDPSGSQAKSPWGHWDRKAEGEKCECLAFLGESGQARRNRFRAALTLPQPLPCANFPMPCRLLTHHSPTGPSSGPREADPPVPTETTGHPDVSPRCLGIAHTGYTSRLPVGFTLGAGASPYRSPWPLVPWSFPRCSISLSPPSLCERPEVWGNEGMPEAVPGW